MATKYLFNVFTGTLDTTNSFNPALFDWQDSVKDKDLTAPPAAVLGDRYLLGLNPLAGVCTGAWAGKDGQIAQYNGIGWDFTSPLTSMAVICDDEPGVIYVFSGSLWVDTAFGANHELSNLVAPTSVNQTLNLQPTKDLILFSSPSVEGVKLTNSHTDTFQLTPAPGLIFNAPAFLIWGKETTAGVTGSALSIRAGQVPTGVTANSGGTSLRSGQNSGTGSSGSVIVESGNAFNGATGSATLRSGLAAGGVASGTITITNSVNLRTGIHSVQVDSIVFTAKTSGPFGPYEFDVSGDETATALSLRNKISASSPTCTASVIGTVVTVGYVYAGVTGNSVVFIYNNGGTAGLTVSGSGTLLGGSDSGNSGAASIATGGVYGKISGGVSIRSGNNQVGLGASGAITVSSGNTVLSNSGIITITSGNSASASSGRLNLQTGTSTTVSSGQIYIATGATTTGTSGTLDIKTGESTAGPSGAAYLHSGPAASGFATGLVQVYSDDHLSTPGNSGDATLVSGRTLNGNSGYINLASGTVLTGNSGGMGIHSGDVTTGNSGSIGMYSGNVTGTGVSGNINLNSGSSIGVSGQIYLSSGNSTSNSSGAAWFYSGQSAAGFTTGSIGIYSGEHLADNGNSGPVNFLSGRTFNGNSGFVSVNSGSVTTGNSGGVGVRSGDVTTGNSGGVSLYSGNAVTGASGNLFINTGTSQNSYSGQINIVGGTSFGNQGGSIYVQSGYSAAGFDTGNVAIYSASRTNAGNTGIINLITGSTSSTGNSGQMTIGTGEVAYASFNGTINVEGGGTATLTVTCDYRGNLGNKTITGNGVDTCATLIGSGYTITSGGAVILQNGDVVNISGAGIRGKLQLNVPEIILESGSILKFTSNSQTTSLQGSPSATASVAYIMPTSDGSAGQAIVTNASGALSWASFQAPLTNPVTGTGVSGQIAFWNGTATQTGDTSLIWDNTNKRLAVSTVSPTEAFMVLKSGTTMLRVGDSATGGSLVMGQDSTLGALMQSHTDSSGNSLQNAASIRMNFGASGFIVSTSPATAIGSPRTYTNRFKVGPGGNIGIATTNPTSNLHVNGSQAQKVTTYTSTPQTINGGQNIILGNMATALVINLPAASGCIDRVYVIKNINTGTVTVTPNGAETIDGGPSAILSTQYESITIVSDGSNWFII